MLSWTWVLGTLHWVSLKETNGCDCVTVDLCTSNGIDVTPYCQCTLFVNTSVCYTQGVCLDAFSSTVYEGATYRECDHSPPPPPHAEACDDPLFPMQWHLPRIRAPEAWAYAHETSSTIVIVDDGIQHTHHDLSVDVDRSFGWNATTGKRLNTSHSDDSVHGTATAGVAAAMRDNGKGGCGVAFSSSLVGVRLLSHNRGGSAFLSDSFASTLSELTNMENAVVSNSWGPPDDGRVDGPGHRSLYNDVDNAMRAFHIHGRGGHGGILLFANGNGGKYDNSNDDGFASHPATISVAAVGDDNRRTSYTEPGTCIDVVAPSNGGLNGIVTTDLLHVAGYSTANSTNTFGGTSASTPIVAGVVALMLDARPDLGATDVRHILVETAHRVHADDLDWVQNDAGVWFSPWYGFGMVDAKRAVETALVWNNEEHASEEVCSESWYGFLGLSAWEWRSIPLTLSGNALRTMDRALLFVDVEHPFRGDVLVRLVSPAGTISQLTFAVPDAVNLRDKPFVPHTYTSNAFYNESGPASGWMVEFLDSSARGRVRSVHLCVTGTKYNDSFSSSMPPLSAPNPSERSWIWIPLGCVLCLSASGVLYAHAS